MPPLALPRAACPEARGAHREDRSHPHPPPHLWREAELMPTERAVRVDRVIDEAIGVRSFDLVDAAGDEELLPWEPGAHIDVVLPGGLVRQYSLCGEVGDRKRYRIGVLREPAGRG